MNIITPEDINSRNWHSLDMGELRKFVADNSEIPNETLVLVQRVEDSYFEKREFNNLMIEGWPVYLVEGDDWHHTKLWNEQMEEEIALRAAGKEAEYSKIIDPSKEITPLTNELKEQFYIPHCITRDKNVVLIYSHY